jgi:plasmid maintenance system antidote protein VapI
VSEHDGLAAPDESAGDLIRRRLRELGWRQHELAWIAGASRAHVSRAARSGPLGAQLAVQIGTALDIDPLELLCLYNRARLAKSKASTAGIVERAAIVTAHKAAGKPLNFHGLDDFVSREAVATETHGAPEVGS